MAPDSVTVQAAPFVFLPDPGPLDETIESMPEVETTMDKKHPAFFEKACTVHEICFGLDRKTDEHSLAAFIKRFANDALLTALIPRLSDEEITATFDFLTNLMHNHFKEKEYHTLFLAD